MNAIFNRRSIRKFKDQSVEPEKIEKLLRAAMQAPSAANQQPWEFIVVQDKAALEALSQISPYSKPVANSGATFVLVANEKALLVPTAWQQDMSAAAENILLEATELGLGSVWFGVATSEEVMETLSKLYALPSYIKPFAMIAVGYPEGQGNVFVDRYKAEKVHFDKW
ncbi:nitroreductase family protein [Fusibacter bizertensis]